MDDACVDVVLATYNGAKYLREQIDSIIQQRYQNWRLLISDDCSTDDTIAIVREYCAIDERISIISEGRKYGSAKANFLKAIDSSTSEYVMLCDQDDYWHPEKIHRAVERLREEERKMPNRPLLYYSDLNVVDENLNILSDSYYECLRLDPMRNSLNNLLVQNVATGCTCAMNRNLVNRLTLDEVDVSRVTMHDSWFALVAVLFGDVIYDEFKSVSYRQHSSNSVGATKYRDTLKSARFRSMKDSIRSSVVQANELLRVYGEEMDVGTRLKVDAFASILGKRKAERASVLVHGGYCKSPRSKALVQVLVTSIMEERNV